MFTLSRADLERMANAAQCDDKEAIGAQPSKSDKSTSIALLTTR
jgi:hypothetical protein